MIGTMYISTRLHRSWCDRKAARERIREPGRGGRCWLNLVGDDWVNELTGECVGSLEVTDPQELFAAGAVLLRRSALTGRRSKPYRPMAV